MTAAATLGAVLRGSHPGRSDPDEVTAYTPIGLPWQDLAVACVAYRHAEQHDIGLVIDLLT